MNINSKTAYDYFRDSVESDYTKDIVTKVCESLLEEDVPVDELTPCIIHHIVKGLSSRIEGAETDNDTLLLAYSGSKYVSIDEHQDSYPRFMLVSKDKLREFTKQEAFEKLCYYGVGEAPPDSIAILDLSPLDAVKIACHANLPKGESWSWDNLQIFTCEMICEYEGSEETFALTMMARYIAFKLKRIAQDSEAHVHSCFRPSRGDCNTGFGISEENSIG